MTAETKTLLEKLVGRWQGPCRTWFQPGELADESQVVGRIEPLLDGQFLRHVYEGELQGKRRTGEELITFNTVTNRWQCSWFDSFHMNYAIMFSEGEATEQGFEVRGAYDVGGGHPPWGWQTFFVLQDADHLTLTAFNISPDDEAAKAVETCYHRLSD